MNSIHTKKKCIEKNCGPPNKIWNSVNEHQENLTESIQTPQDMLFMTKLIEFTVLPVLNTQVKIES